MRPKLAEEKFHDPVNRQKPCRPDEQGQQKAGREKSCTAPQRARPRTRAGASGLNSEQAINARREIAVGSDKRCMKIGESRVGSHSLEAEEGSGQSPYRLRIAACGRVVGGPLGDFPPGAVEQGAAFENRDGVGS